MVRFFNKDIKFNLKHKLLLKKWIKSVVQKYDRRVGDINVILCDDPSILEINMQFLSHDYYTDIITFDYCEGDNNLSTEDNIVCQRKTSQGHIFIDDDGTVTVESDIKKIIDKF